MNCFRQAAQQYSPLRPGDLLVAYSDGMTEPENEFGEYGEERLEDLLRQAQGTSRALEERTAAVADQTESLADDTALAQVSAAARRARQDLGALIRVVGGARNQVGS